MTKTEWEKVKRALETRGEYVAKDGFRITKEKGRYGFEYICREPEIGCIAVEYSLESIADWLVD